MIRTVRQWKAILEHRNDLMAAKRILKDLVHYDANRLHQHDDMRQLANALIAFAEIENSEED